ncbi:MAG: putative small integral membrane protein [Halieaceae bacterium]|jgi:predicted small integral membrane protein
MSWMAWTAPTALFFAAIALSLIVLTTLEILRPTVRARGFLPMATTRGDRFFISLLSAAFIHLLWLAFLDEGVAIASALAALCAALLMRWG